MKNKFINTINKINFNKLSVIFISFFFIIAVLPKVNSLENSSISGDTVTFGESPDTNDESSSDNYGEPHSSAPPAVTDTTYQAITEGSTFAPIDSNDDVSVVEDADTSTSSSSSDDTGPSNETTAGAATITGPGFDYNQEKTTGSRATDPDDLFDESSAEFDVSSVNDSPNVPSDPDPDGDSVTSNVRFGKNSNSPCVEKIELSLAKHITSSYEPESIKYETVSSKKIIAWDNYDLLITGIQKLITAEPEIDPDLSFVDLTDTGFHGLTTCPAGDGFKYKYVKVTVQDSNGNPIEDIPASDFSFIVTAPSDVRYIGELSCTFTSINAQTNENGEIQFEVQADNSIGKVSSSAGIETTDAGNITIQVIVDGIPLNDSDDLPCNSFDINVDGKVDLQDFDYFYADFGTSAQRSDFNWDEKVDLNDFSHFAVHFGHKRSNNPPDAPSGPNPDDDKTNVNINADLSWSCSDPESDPLTYDVYFGTSNPPPLIVNNQSGTSYNPGTMKYDTTYYWKIIAWDNHGDSNASEIWSFTTEKKPPSDGDDKPSDGPTKLQGPTAVATASETTEFINVTIDFDGSGSTDPDGDIVSWDWDFGDGNTSSGEQVTYAYAEPGEYIVTLTVTDDDDLTDDDTLEITILKPNHDPTDPVVTGNTTGEINVTYEYTAVSTDLDNDTISYIFDWDDGNITTTEFLENGTMTTQNHTWASAGVYNVAVKAYDNISYSGTTSYRVYIGLNAIFIEGLGYITDDDTDETYDTFHDTDVETALGQDGDNYLIDSDGDGKWDHAYNLTTGLLTYFEFVYNKYHMIFQTELSTPGFDVIPVLAMLGLLVIILRRRKR